MSKAGSSRRAGLMEIVSGLLVIVFSILGLASLADRLETAVTGKAAKIANGPEVPNKEKGNRSSRRIV